MTAQWPLCTIDPQQRPSGVIMAYSKFHPPSSHFPPTHLAASTFCCQHEPPFVAFVLQSGEIGEGANGAKLIFEIIGTLGELLRRKNF